MIEMNTTIFHYNYRVDPELGKIIFLFDILNVHVQRVFIDLIKIGYQIVLHHLIQVMLMLEIVTITKYLNITLIGSSWNS